MFLVSYYEHFLSIFDFDFFASAFYLFIDLFSHLYRGVSAGLPDTIETSREIRNPAFIGCLSA